MREGGEELGGRGGGRKEVGGEKEEAAEGKAEGEGQEAQAGIE